MTLPIFITVGYNSVIAAERIVAILNPVGNPVRRMWQAAREAGTLLDATRGRKINAVIVLDTGQVVLSARHIETLLKRMEQIKKQIEEEEI